MTQVSHQELQRQIEQFKKRITAQRVTLHGFTLVQGKEVLAEEYYAPFHENSLHRMFSVAKSFTSLAIGLLCDEGKISLDDKICDYFPEKLPEEGAHPWLAELTIRQMLTMTTCYASTTFKRYDSKDWTESFFRVAPDHPAGTLFSYDTSSSHTLAALVEKLTGMSMLDYLRVKVLDQIGFSKEAYIIPDEVGVSQGGSGLVCTLRDMTAVACLCRDYGMYEGEQLLPRWYIEEAMADSVTTELQPVIDEQQGYGYMFWRTRHNGYCMYGMGGQLALIFPQHDLVFTTIADTQGMNAGLQMMYDVFYDTIFRLYEVEDIEPRMEVLPVSGEADSCFAQKFNGCRIEMAENKQGMKWICPDFVNHKITYENATGVHTISYGYQTWEKQNFPCTEFEAIASGAWQQENHFIMKVYVIEEAFCHMYLELGYREDGSVGVRLQNTGEPFLQGYNGILGGRVLKENTL